MAIYIKQGDTETLTTNPIKTCDGVGIDLSDAVVKLIIKENMEDPDENAILLKSLEHPESNIVSFQLSADETAAIMIGQYV